jgi:hypothetical protein
MYIVKSLYIPINQNVSKQQEKYEPYGVGSIFSAGKLIRKISLQPNEMLEKHQEYIAKNEKSAPEKTCSSSERLQP